MLTKADIVDIIFNAVNTQAAPSAQQGGAACAGGASANPAKAKTEFPVSRKQQSITVPRKKILLDEDVDSSAKVFLSDWQLRKQYVKGTKILEVPRNGIISPLAQDWIDFEGIKLVYK